MNVYTLRLKRHLGGFYIDTFYHLKYENHLKWLMEYTNMKMANRLDFDHGTILKDP